MPPSGPVKDGFAPHVLSQLVGHISPMHYFDFGSVVVVEDHCRHLESAERHATPRRAWGGGRALIPDFRSRGISHRPGTPGSALAELPSQIFPETRKNWTRTKYTSCHSTEVRPFQIGGTVRTPELKGPRGAGPVGYAPGSEIGD